MKILRKLITVLFMGSLVFLQGCSSFSVDEYLPDKKVEYKKSEQVGKNL